MASKSRDLAARPCPIQWMYHSPHNFIYPGVDEWELATPISLCHRMFTDLFLVYLFFSERKVVPVQ